MCQIVDAIKKTWKEDPSASDLDLSAAAVRAAGVVGDKVTMLIRDPHGSVHIHRKNAGDAWIHPPQKQEAGP